MGHPGPTGACDGRSSPRVRAQLEVNLLVTPAEAGDGEGRGRQNLLSLLGHTRDMSEGGLAVVLPSFDCNYRQLFGEGLKVRLDLPYAQIIADASAVRAAPLNEESPGDGCVFGLRITAMGEADHRHYVEFLRTGD